MKLLGVAALSLALCLAGCGSREPESSRQDQQPGEETSTTDGRLTPGVLERILGDQIGSWENKALNRPVGSGEPYGPGKSRNTVRWKEKGKSLQLDFQMIEPVAGKATGNWEYHASRDAFIYTFQEENGPAVVMLFETYDPEKLTFSGQIISPELPEGRSAVQRCEKIGPDRYMWTTKHFEGGKLLSTYEVIQTRVQP